MKLAGAVSRYFLGLMFLIFGLNDFLNFIPAKMPPGRAGEFAGAFAEQPLCLGRRGGHGRLRYPVPH